MSAAGGAPPFAVLRLFGALFAPVLLRMTVPIAGRGAWSEADDFDSSINSRLRHVDALSRCSSRSPPQANPLFPSRTNSSPSIGRAVFACLATFPTSTTVLELIGQYVEASEIAFTIECSVRSAWEATTSWPGWRGAGACPRGTGTTPQRFNCPARAVGERAGFGSRRQRRISAGNHCRI